MDTASALFFQVAELTLSGLFIFLPLSPLHFKNRDEDTAAEGDIHYVTRLHPPVNSRKVDSDFSSGISSGEDTPRLQFS